MEYRRIFFWRGSSRLYRVTHTHISLIEDDAANDAADSESETREHAAAADDDDDDDAETDSETETLEHAYITHLSNVFGVHDEFKLSLAANESRIPTDVLDNNISLLTRFIQRQAGR